MERILLKSKIHRATVTEADIDYQGSLSLDALLMEAAAIAEFEQVHVYNLSNGERFSTYAIRAEPGSGMVKLNGAAARLAVPGDQVIIAAYAHYGEEEAARHRPRLLVVDERNAPVENAEV